MDSESLLCEEECPETGYIEPLGRIHEPMDSVAARAAVGRRFSNHNRGEYGYFDHSTHDEDMQTADAYGDAKYREGKLAGHVEACGKLIDTGDGTSYCGEDGYICDVAKPTKEVT